MPLYLITGFPGTGKTTVAAQLMKSSHYAYDLEAMDRYMRLLSRRTEKRNTPPHPIPRGWFETEGRVDLDMSRLNDLYALHKETDNVYVCSHADNQSDHYDLSKKIFVLTISDTILQQRLTDRGAYGSAPSELEETLALRPEFETGFTDIGAIPIDTGVPVSEIARQIVRLS